MSKLSFTTMATPGLGALESIRTARRYGYAGVDLRVSDNLGEISPDSTAGEIAEIRSAFSSEGIQASGLLCYNEQGGREEGSWSRMRESILRHLEIAALLGSPSIRIFGGNPGEYVIRGDFIKRTSDVLSETVSKSGTGVCILIQNHRSSLTAAEVFELMSLAGIPELGMAYSPDHSYINGEDIEGSVLRMKSSIRQLYVADLIEDGKEYRDILPGKGRVPLPEVYKALGGSSFDGWVTFKWEKIWNKSLEEPDIALPYFIKYFNGI